MADRNAIIEKIKALLAKTTANGCDRSRNDVGARQGVRHDGRLRHHRRGVQVAKDEAAILHADPPDLKDPHQHQSGG